MVVLVHCVSRDVVRGVRQMPSHFNIVNNWVVGAPVTYVNKDDYRPYLW
jgi:hypothetical protein